MPLIFDLVTVVASIGVMRIDTRRAEKNGEEDVEVNLNLVERTELAGH